MSLDPKQQAARKYEAAKYSAGLALKRIDELERIALLIMPAFRDKLDFSDPKDYAKLVEYAYKAAEAAMEHRQKLVAEANASLQRAQEIAAAQGVVVEGEDAS